ncbi:DUF3151 domain-containing protein [Cryobacterium fucosi]|uniref:DUF3151 domain-containing protein n=1 Tax=Cryobacterium fucosi TaxID=1259157 RepID=UPI003B96E13C
MTGRLTRPGDPRHAGRTDASGQRRELGDEGRRVGVECDDDRGRGIRFAGQPVDPGGPGGAARGLRKDRLFEELLQEGVGALADTLREARAGLHGRAALEALIAALLDRIASNTALAKLMASEIFRTDRTWQKTLFALRHEALAVFAEAIYEVNPGSRDDGTCGLMASSVFGAVLMSGLEWLVFDPDRHRDARSRPPSWTPSPTACSATDPVPHPLFGPAPGDRACRDPRRTPIVTTDRQGGIRSAIRSSVTGDNLIEQPETLLPAEPEVIEALRRTGSADLASVVAAHPTSSLAWAVLADVAHLEGRTIESYAFARVGYHRGLDALRKAGWRGHGPVRWTHEPNRGVLRALYALRRAAREIGENDEFDRLTTFLNDADHTVISRIEQEAVTPDGYRANDPAPPTEAFFIRGEN